jgi:hypothetical protein
MAYNTAYDLESLMVNTKAATVYTAHENSLFLGGAIVPQVQLPAGSIVAQIPVMGTVLAEKLTSADPDALDDFNALTVTDTKVTIEANIYAARHVLRDLGGIDPAETGRVLGNAIQAAFDADVITAMNGFTASTSDSDPMTVDALFDAAAQIRATGETGQLVGIVSPTEAANLMKDVGSTAYAGGDFQTEGLRNGFIGTMAGIRMFQSSYISGANKGFVFGADAMRIAMFKNVDLEVQRRAAAVGNDIIANLHAGVGVVDATRGVKLVNV